MSPEPILPERIGRLYELANNLWWSWHDRARDLFRALDYGLWRLSDRNPVRQLHQISPEELQAAAKDEAFLKLYDSVMAEFDTDMSAQDSWFTVNYANELTGPVAYFSMEFAIHNSLPIYAGGLGILAGDICREAGELGLPLVAVGFMYPQGYFHQHISAEGWQEEVYRQLDFDDAPINRVTTDKGSPLLARVEVGNRMVFVSAWEVRVGRVRVYLLDTNVNENAPQDRQLSARLYIADQELRIEQEIVLGIGGVRILRALGIQPAIWHANEGHASFMMLERVREGLQNGLSFTEATRKVRATTAFTTHTPVPAGSDVFPIQLVEKYLYRYREAMRLTLRDFAQLGQDGSSDSTFNMTVLALKMAEHRNAVSQLHAQVTRKMWRRLWPGVSEDKVPIKQVTNGIHVPSWVAPDLFYLYQKYLGEDWVKRHDDPGLWQRVLDIPDEELWAVRQLLKRKLTGAMLERAQKRWVEGVAPKQVLAIGTLLHAGILTIGFVRRFTEYKRPALIFRDLERLKRIVTNPYRPVQIVFAGKSHPADFPSKYLLHEVYTLATDPAFQGRIAFVEDYDMYLAHYLAHGVDVWLNNPRRLQEACGTSGMKASLNGVLHLSVRDGWWYEGYNGANGWAIGDSVAPSGDEDKADAQALYDLLEKEVVPLYYDQDRSGVPHGWLRIVKEAIRSVVPVFCTRRMLKEYTERIYLPAARSLKG